MLHISESRAFSEKHRRSNRRGPIARPTHRPDSRERGDQYPHCANRDMNWIKFWTLLSSCQGSARRSDQTRNELGSRKAGTSLPMDPKTSELETSDRKTRRPKINADVVLLDHGGFRAGGRNRQNDERTIAAWNKTTKSRHKNGSALRRNGPSRKPRSAVALQQTRTGQKRSTAATARIRPAMAIGR